MNLDLLTAISPIDGRYRGKTEQLANYFSEYALIRYRVRVEIEYFITLCELPLPQLASFDKSLFERLRDIYRNFDENEAQRVKDIEKITNHDVKAVEYFIKEEFDKIGGLDAYKEFIHFGLTSQDINNTSVPLSVKEALEECFYPQVEELIAQLQTYAGRMCLCWLRLTDSLLHLPAWARKSWFMFTVLPSSSILSRLARLQLSLAVLPVTTMLTM